MQEKYTEQNLVSGKTRPVTGCLEGNDSLDTTWIQY